MKIPKFLATRLCPIDRYSSLALGATQKIQVGEAVWTVSIDQSDRRSFELERPLSSGQVLKLTFLTAPLKMSILLDGLWVESCEDTKKITITGVRTIVENELLTVVEQIEAQLGEEKDLYDRQQVERRRAERAPFEEAKRRAEEAK